MAGIDNGTELRIAVVMTGGISLAIWIGGVAAELLHLLESPEDYDIDTTCYRPVIDVVTGTSAGGLNGALMGAAIAWGIPPEQFAEDVRRTWIELADIENMLRSPLEKDPPSLLYGQDVFEAELGKVLRSWEQQKAPSLDRRRAYRGQPIPSVALTATLLDPSRERFFDSLGQPLVELRHTAVIRFGADDYAREDVWRQLARAGRATAAFPIAFEPAFLGDQGAGEPDMHDVVKGLPSPGKWAMDGGVLVNRPLGLAFDAIKDRDAVGPFERTVAYIAPDPAEPSSETRAGNRWRDPSSIPTMTEVLGKVVEASRTESLANELERWRDRNLMLGRQRDLRLSLGLLDPANLDALVKAFYPTFLDQQAESSAAKSVENLMRHVGGEAAADWLALKQIMVPTRRADSWMPKPDFPADPPPAGAMWDWTFSSLRYVAETMRWLLHGSGVTKSDEVERSKKACLATIEAVLRALTAFYDVSASYWDWQRENSGLGKRPSAGWQEEDQRLQQWAAQAYANWPCPPGPHIPEALGKALATYVATFRCDALDWEDSKIASWIGPNADPVKLNQQHHRYLLGFLAEELGRRYADWSHVAHAPAEGDDPKAGSQPDGESEHVRRLASAWSRTGHAQARGAGSDAPAEHLRPVWYLLKCWVIEVRTNQWVRAGEPIDLFQISANHESGYFAAGLLPDAARIATNKVTGIQAGHFGAFYKRTWRANDWMWGRLDGSQHLANMIEKRPKLGAPTASQLRKRQANIGRSELPVLAGEIRQSERRGELTEAEGHLLDLLKTQPGLETEDQVKSALNKALLGGETIIADIDTSRFAVGATKALAVAATALQGEKSGLGRLRTLLTQVRNLVLLPLHALAVVMRSSPSSVTSTALLGSTVMVSMLVVVTRVGFGIDIPPAIVGVAYSVLFAFIILAMLRLGGVRAFLVPLPAALILAALGLAQLLTWRAGTGGAVEGDQVLLSCADPPVPVLQEDGFYSFGCEVVDVVQSPRFSASWFLWFAVGAALIALAILLWRIGRAISTAADIGHRLRGVTRGVLAREFWFGFGGWPTVVRAGSLAVLASLSLLLWSLSGDVGESGWRNLFVETVAPWLVDNQATALTVLLLSPTILSGFWLAVNGYWQSDRPLAGLSQHITQLRKEKPELEVGYLLSTGYEPLRRKVAKAFVDSEEPRIMVDVPRGQGPGIREDLLRIADVVVSGPRSELDDCGRTELAHGRRLGRKELIYVDGSFHPVPRSLPGRFRLHEREGKVHFDLCDADGTPILVSQPYGRRRDALTGVDSVRANGPIPDRYQHFNVDGRPTIVLAAGNHVEIARTAETVRLETEEIAELVMEWLQTYAALSPIESERGS